ncbi:MULTISPECIES: hypothetical protein [Streptomyces]|uniref:hypothetical protein n=1 Tax=Streptomyces TaxID=1883 RepID=UPI002248EACC|nr:hypothetical protein [Streptomyces sp. JHD 1]MCX2969690.1 hypothetical protein [Streptomyces sp. JHD 1]
MVTFQELNDLRLGKLKSAVTDWSEMAEKLTRLADGEDGGTSAAGLSKRAKAADWKGHNATVTKGFVTTTAAEFDDVVTAAKSVHTILSGAHEAFTRHQRELGEAVDRAARKNIHITPAGEVMAAFCAPGTAQDATPTQAELDGAAKEIGDILRAASETDRTTAAALRYHATDAYDFRSHGFDSFEDAGRTVRDSNELIELGKRDPDELSNKELARFNELSKRHADDPVFAERVATGLGAERALTFSADAANLSDWSPGPDAERGAREARTKLLAATEQHLGTTLATATHSGSDAMQTWKERAVALGGEDVGGGPGSGRARVLGFQAMSNLMRHGTYERDFLNEYGDALVRYEKKHTGDVRDPGPGGRTRENVLPWDAAPSYARFDRLHHGEDDDAGGDPMTGFMIALSNNPEASTEFFSSSEDHSAWVLKDRPEFKDVVPGFHESADDYDGPSAYREAAGQALVAGATGMDPGDAMAQAPEHTDQHRTVLENSLKHLAARGDDFPAELRDDMAKVLVNHGVSVHETMSDNSNSAPLDGEQLMQVTTQISLDQEAHAYLNDGLHYSIIQDYATETEHPEDSLNRAGRTIGFLEEARHNAIGERTGDELAEVGWDKNYRYHGFGSLAVVIPGVDDVVQRGVDILATRWMESEQDRINGEAVEDHRKTYELRTTQLVSLADAWYAYNEDWAEGRTGFSAKDGVYEVINNAANNGNVHGDGMAGDQ